MAIEDLTKRLGVFAELADKSKRKFGRTALMKLCYLLQVVKGVPLGYDFSLYSYGPFDAQVLADLNTAVSVGVLSSELEYYPSGYGYLIGPSGSSKEARTIAAQFLGKYTESISWVAHNFASRSASELELISTIVFVWRDSGKVAKAELVKLVKSVKPHFSDQEIDKQVLFANENQLIKL